MKKNIIYNSDVSTILRDKTNNIAIKTVKRKKITDDWFNNYKKLQDKTPHVVKIIDKIDDQTYTMEYVDGIVTDLYKLLAPHMSKTLNKTDYVRLFKCINHTWTSAMELSTELADDRFFVHQDFHLKNIAVLKNKNGYHFKFLDADAWFVSEGFHGIDAFYTTQLKIVLSMQRAWTNV